MGLSSNQVSNRGNTLLEAQNLELPQHHQNQKLELVKCPRCDSTNTKFCYYNNYNKSQPRHFCRACKRHWTKGGTLRNVPIGGVRKNKRVKKTATTSITLTSSVPSLEVVDHDHKRILPSLDKDFGIGNETFVSSSTHETQNQSMIFPFSTNSSSFDTNPCSNVYNYGEEFKTMEGSSINTQHWEIPTTCIGMGISNYWSWEDIDSFVSTDLNVPWDDESDVKP